MSNFSKLITRYLLLLVIITGVLLAHPTAGHAYTQTRLMDDQIFDKVGSLSQSQIDDFLHGRTGPYTALGSASTCLANYTDVNFHWDGSHWHYGDNTMSTSFTTLTSSPWNSAWGPAQIPASQALYMSAQQWGLNPEVMIATLQKENTLITRTDCPGWRYNSAMGYDCSEGGGCPAYPTHAGFSRQVLWGGWQLKFNKERSIGNTAWDGDDSLGYSGFMTRGTYKRCGSCTATFYDGYANIDGNQVFMENGTTASLYTYTPHLGNSTPPNFEQWFGSAYAINTSTIVLGTVTQPNPNPAIGETVTYTVTFNNTLGSAVTVDGIGIVGRAGSTSGANQDFGWQGPVTLQPGVSQQFTFTKLIRDSGTLYAWPAIYANGGYVQYNNWGTTMVSHTPNLTLSQPLSTTPSSTIYAGQNVTFSAKLKNNESHSISYDAIGIPVKFYDTYNYDAVWVGPGTVGPGAEVTLSGTRNIDKPGPFSYWVSDYFGGKYTTIDSVKKFNSVAPSPNFSVSGLSFTNAPPVQGQDLGASFSVTNNLPVPIDVDAVGVVGRFGTLSGANRDIGWQGPFHFNAGETKSFAGYSRTITDIGTHYYWIGILYNGSYLQFNNWGSTIISQVPSFSVSGLNFTNTSPAQGENLGASFSVTNNLSVPIDVDAVGVVGRLGTFDGPNRDLNWQGPVHFNAGETKSFTESGTVTEAGTHYYWVGILYKGSYLQYNNWGSTIVSH